MAKIFSKKALAVVLTVAMLLSCMVFSFSADAAEPTLLYRNSFDNASDGNWYSVYTKADHDVSTASNWNINDNRQKALVDTENGWMETTFYSSNVAGFRVYHEEATGNANGSFALQKGYVYTVQFDYRLKTAPTDTKTVLDITAGLSRGGAYWTWDTTGAVKSYYNFCNGASSKGLAKTGANVTAAMATETGAFRTASVNFDLREDIYDSRDLQIIFKAAYDGNLTGAVVQIDNIKVYRYASIDDAPLDPSLAGGTLIVENHFAGGASTNWYGFFNSNSGALNSSTTWHYNFHSTPYKGCGGNYVNVDTTNEWLDFGFTSETAESKVSAIIFRHESDTQNETPSDYRYAASSSTWNKQGNFNFEAGKKYAVTFNYKVNSFNENTASKVGLYIGYTGDFLDGDKTIASHYTGTDKGNALVTTVGASDLGKDWQTAVGMIDVTANKPAHLFAAVVGNSGSDLTNASILVDNVKIYLLDESKMPTISFVYDGDNVGSAKGVPGAAFAMPEFTGLPENTDVSGFYTDEALTEAASLPTTFGNASATYYVGVSRYLVNDPWSFEDVAHGTHISARDLSMNEYAYYWGGVRQVRNDKGARTGSNALVVNNENGSVTDKYGETARDCARNFFVLKNGSGEYAKVKAGHNYLLTYWVMVPMDAPYETFDGSLWLAGIGTKTTAALQTGNAAQNVFFNDYSTGYVSVPADGKWHRVTRYINGANIDAESETSNFDAGDGNVLVGLSHTEGNETFDVYLDDIDLIPLDDMVAAEYDDGNDREQWLFGEEVETGNGTQLTHLHRNTKTGEGTFTSVRLGAKYKAGSADGNTILLGGVEYDLAERGIVVDLAENANKLAYNKNLYSSFKSTGFDSAWHKTEDNEFTYTLRLANISKALVDKGDSYVYRSCYRIVLDGVYAEYNTTAPMASVPVQGSVSAPFTFAELYEDVASEGGAWFN